MPEFIYQFLPGDRPDLATNPQAWTRDDEHVAADHVAYLEKAHEEGTVIIAGRSQDGIGPAIVVIEVEDERAAEAFMESDPFIARGLFRGSLHLYRAAFLRGRPSQGIRSR